LPDAAGFLDEILSHGFSLGIVSHHQGVVPIGREELLNGPQFVDHMLVFVRA
jgi:DNA repair exonuclease SbcCD ATPase subunit